MKTRANQTNYNPKFKLQITAIGLGNLTRSDPRQGILEGLAMSIKTESASDQTKKKTREPSTDVCFSRGDGHRKRLVTVFRNRFSSGTEPKRYYIFLLTR